jgi:hypothetical protein
MTSCDKGSQAEFLFCAEATARGFSVLVPWGHNSTSDIWIAKLPLRPISVQVKRAWFDEKHSNYSINISRGSTNKLAYLKGDFDVLAAYLPDQDKFILWDFDQIAGRKKIAYTQHCADRQPDNWEILDTVLK